MEFSIGSWVHFSFHSFFSFLLLFFFTLFFTLIFFFFLEETLKADKESGGSATKQSLISREDSLPWNPEKGHYEDVGQGEEGENVGTTKVYFDEKGREYVLEDAFEEDAFEDDDGFQSDDSSLYTAETPSYPEGASFPPPGVGAPGGGPSFPPFQTYQQQQQQQQQYGGHEGQNYEDNPEEYAEQGAWEQPSFQEQQQYGGYPSFQPQYRNQYSSSHYSNSHYSNPQYSNPQYSNPQYSNPQYSNPQSQYQYQNQNPYHAPVARSPLPQGGYQAQTVFQGSPYSTQLYQSRAAQPFAPQGQRPQPRGFPPQGQYPSN